MMTSISNQLSHFINPQQQQLDLDENILSLNTLQNKQSVHFHQVYNIITMIKINLILHQETLRRSKSEGKSSSSVSSFTLNASDLLKSAEANGQIKPILKQSRKNNIFSKKYLLS